MTMQGSSAKTFSFFPVNAAQQEHAGRLEYLLLLIACYALSFGSFENLGSLGGQDRAIPENPDFDLIAAVKAATRLAALALVGFGLFLGGRGVRWRIVRFQFFPWVLLGFWGIASTTWSPMPAYTFGHSAEFLLLVMIAALAALVCTGPERLMCLLRQMCLILFLYLLVLLIMSILNPDSARIVRAQLETESVLFAADAETTFVMNPPEIAGIAALGLVLLCAAKFIWNWRWSRIVLLPFAALGCWVAFITQTRTSIATMIILCGLCFLVWGNRKILMAALALIILAGSVYIITDPYLVRLEGTEKKIGFYVSRGQSTAEMRRLSGRAGHWAEAAEGLREHPAANIIGFGYSMATPTGKMWHEDAYRRYTGHNILLDVYAGTGLFGLFLFAWGSLRLFRGVCQGLLGPDKKLSFLTLVIFLFIFMTGMFGDSIVGPIDPTSVAIFALIGAGAWRSETTMQACAQIAQSARSTFGDLSSGERAHACLLLQQELPFHGGVPRSFLWLARHLPREHFHYGSLQSSQDSILPNIAQTGAETVSFGSRNPLVLAWRVKRYIHDNNIKIIFACSFRSYYIAKLAASGEQCRVVMWIRDFSITRSRAKYLLFRLLSHDDWLISNSGTALRAHVSPGRDRTALIYSGVEIPAKVDKWIARIRLGLPRGATVLLYAADCQPYKDHETLLRAFGKLAPQWPNLYLALCGRMGDLPRHLNNKGLLPDTWGDRVIFYGPRDDMEYFFSAADIYVHPCYIEAFGNAVVEAMMSGLPVVAARAGALPEILADTGVLFQPRDPESLATELESLIANEASRSAFGQKAAARAAAEFTIDSFAARFLQIHDQIVMDAPQTLESSQECDAQA